MSTLFGLECEEKEGAKSPGVLKAGLCVAAEAGGSSGNVLWPLGMKTGECKADGYRDVVS